MKIQKMCDMVPFLVSCHIYLEAKKGVLTLLLMEILSECSAKCARQLRVTENKHHCYNFITKKKSFFICMQAGTDCGVPSIRGTLSPQYLDWAMMTGGIRKARRVYRRYSWGEHGIEIICYVCMSVNFDVAQVTGGSACAVLNVWEVSCSREVSSKFSRTYPLTV